MLRDSSKVTVLFISISEWAPKPAFLPHQSSHYSVVPFCFLLLLSFREPHFCIKKMVQNQFCSTWKKKKKVVNLTVVPGPPSLGSWPEHDGNFGPGGVLKLVVLAKCYGTPQAASTWGSLLMITGKLGGIDGFGKHFCRVSLTEKRKGIWYMLIDRLFQKSVQKYKI